jgi:hypothetical protein
MRKLTGPDYLLHPASIKTQLHESQATFMQPAPCRGIKRKCIALQTGQKRHRIGKGKWCNPASKISVDQTCILRNPDTK